MLVSELLKMGIPFTHVSTSDSVGGWTAQDILLRGWITLGRSKSSMHGLAARRSAGTISGGCAGRMVLSVPTAGRSESRGRCRAAFCAAEPVIGRYR